MFGHLGTKVNIFFRSVARNSMGLEWIHCIVVVNYNVGYREELLQVPDQTAAQPGYFCTNKFGRDLPPFSINSKGTGLLGDDERGETTGSKILFSFSQYSFLICSEWIPAFF